MVILDADFGRSPFRPAEDDPPLVVDANGIESAPTALQGFQPVAGRDGHVAKLTGSVELDQLSQGDPNDRGIPAIFILVKELCGIAVGKGQDNRCKRKNRRRQMSSTACVVEAG